MDLQKTIEFLYDEKEKLERVIASLEELQRHSVTLPELPRIRDRRGRKYMGQEERQVVSARMKRYWASRREEPQEQAGATSLA